MLSASAEATRAMSASRRRIFVRATLDLIDPDISFLPVESSVAAAFSNGAQLHDKELDAASLATFEAWHWPLDGSCLTVGAKPMDAQIGFVSAGLSDDGGAVSGVFVQLNVIGVDILSRASVCFSKLPFDGFAVDFMFEIFSGATRVFETVVTGNGNPIVTISGFRVYNVTAIRVTPTLWSRPNTRVRFIEIIPGVFERWDGRDLYSAETYREVDFSLVTLPYGSAAIVVDNSDRRYDPRNRDGIFPLIESRQMIPVEFGIALPDDSVEWFPAGVYYLRDMGWETEDCGRRMKFNLVDIVGLLRDRDYVPPAILPTTLYGWAESVVVQLGANFAGRFFVAPELADFPLTTSPEQVIGTTCGEILRLTCMASGAVCFADLATGRLMVSVAPGAPGASLSPDNLTEFPKQRANLDIARLTFHLKDEQFVVNGNNTSASTTLSIGNFFIADTNAAQIVARRIMGYYGGQEYESVGLGDLRTEIGDLDSIEVYPGDISGARLKRVRISVSSAGIVKDVESLHLQPTGEEIYSNTEVLTRDGAWTAPEGVTHIRLTLIGGGQGGQGGAAGSGINIFSSVPGEPGAGGASGLVWTQYIAINPGQTFGVTIGRGGAGGSSRLHGESGGGGTLGGATLMTPAYSSANGTQYDGMTDIATGNLYAKSGAEGPASCTKQTAGANAVNGAGNGGDGGGGGMQMLWHIVGGGSTGTLIIDKSAVAGGVGGRGGDGCVIVSYDLPMGV